MSTAPSVLFVCVHNAGRSQMAAGFLTALSGGAVDVRSAGSMPADQVNPVAVDAMAEVGIDIRAEQPKVLTTEAVQASDVVVSVARNRPAPVVVEVGERSSTMTSTPTWTDPREQIEAVVMMANGRLAPRSFADRAEAEAWARPELGDEVLERNLVCSCDS